MCPQPPVIPPQPAATQTFSPMASDRHPHPTLTRPPQTQPATPIYRETPNLPDQRGGKSDRHRSHSPAGSKHSHLGADFARAPHFDRDAHASNPLSGNTRSDSPQLHPYTATRRKPYNHAPQQGLPETAPYYRQSPERELPVHHHPITPHNTGASPHPSPEPTRHASAQAVLETTQAVDCEPARTHNEWAECAKLEPVYNPWQIIERGEKVKLKLHPLLTSASLGSEAYLQWDMRWHTGQCQRSCDDGMKSWSHGRSHPATCPRVNCLRIICDLLPWELTVNAGDMNSGVTCGEVVEAIHAFLAEPVTQAEFDSEGEDKRAILYYAHRRNRSIAQDAPGGRLPRTLLKLDYLDETIKFGGLVAVDASSTFAENIYNKDTLRGTFELVCLKRYPEKGVESDRHARPNAGQSHSDSEDSLYLDTQHPSKTQPFEHTPVRHEAATHPAAAATTYQYEARPHASARHHDHDHAAPAAAREHRPVVNQTTRPDASYPSYPPLQGASHPPLGGTSYPAAQPAPYAPPPPGQYTPHGGVHFADGGQAARPPHIQPDIEPETRRRRTRVKSQRSSTPLPTAHADRPRAQQSVR